MLRDHGFATAVHALTQTRGLEHAIQVEVDVAAADLLPEQEQAALYEIVREALEGAIRRGPPSVVLGAGREPGRRPPARSRSTTTPPASGGGARSRCSRSGRGPSARASPSSRTTRAPRCALHLRGTGSPQAPLLRRGRRGVGGAAATSAAAFADGARSTKTDLADRVPARPAWPRQAGRSFYAPRRVSRGDGAGAPGRQAARSAPRRQPVRSVVGRPRSRPRGGDRVARSATLAATPPRPRAVSGPGSPQLKTHSAACRPAAATSATFVTRSVLPSWRHLGADRGRVAVLLPELVPAGAPDEEKVPLGHRGGCYPAADSAAARPSTSAWASPLA